MRDFIWPEDATGTDEENALSPEQKARKAMRASLSKRFYTSADLVEKEGKFSIQLDGRTVKTPAKKDLILPQKAAQLVAEEWQTQKEVIDPAKMPMTRLANSAIDGVTDTIDEVHDEIIRFASSDLICYRASHPQELVERQNEHWDPLLRWAGEAFSARFKTSTGIIHVEQAGETLAAFAARVEKFSDPLQLAALHSMTTLTGSALIALALAENAVSLEAGWQAAHVDEDWNCEKWGEDEEAQKRRAFRFGEMQAAFNLFHAVEL